MFCLQTINRITLNLILLVIVETLKLVGCKIGNLNETKRIYLETITITTTTVHDQQTNNLSSITYGIKLS